MLFLSFFLIVEDKIQKSITRLKKKNEGTVKLHGTFKIVEKKMIERVCTDTKKIKIVVSYLEGQLDK